MGKYGGAVFSKASRLTNIHPIPIASTVSIKLVDGYSREKEFGESTTNPTLDWGSVLVE